jgi:hypothetical protein
MFDWLWKWWLDDNGDNNNNNDDEENFNDFEDDQNGYDFNMYKAPTLDKHPSHLLKWQTFKCVNYNFNYRYLMNQNNVKCYSIVDFFKGIMIKLDNIHDCDWNEEEIYHLNEIIFNKKTEKTMNTLGSLFTTQKGLVNILKGLHFAHKIEVVLSLMNDYVQPDDLRDKIENVLQNVRKLNMNSEKFIESHETFKNEVNMKFTHFDTRLNELSSKLNIMKSSEKLKTTIQQNQQRNRVIFPKDITKHQHLAVFSERVDDHTKLAFISGQETHFRKRKAQFENDMELLYNAVHPNPLLAIQCINENFYSKNYKVIKLGKRMIHVNCDVGVAKSIVNETL